MSGETGHKWASARAVLLAGLLLTLLAFLSTVTFSFVYDDHQIQGERALALKALAGFFTRHLWAGIAQHGGYYRPVLQVWVAILYSFFGHNTVAWHVAAIAMHLLLTWLVYLVVAEYSHDRLLAALAAAVFGIHPVHVEVVAWISGAMSEGLLAVLTMTSLLGYLRARQRPLKSTAWFAGSCAAFAAALLVKETPIVLPLVFLAYEWTRPDEPNAPASPRLSHLAALLAPYGLIAAVYVVIRHLVLRNAGASAATVRNTGSAWLTLPSAAWFYLRQLVWPADLSIFQPVLRIATPQAMNFWLPLAGVVVAAALLIGIARRSRTAAFAVCFMVAMLLIPLAAIGELPKYEIVHDRYLYLPSAGFAILVALGLQKLAARMTRPGVLLLLAGIGVTIVTATQANYWNNDVTLYEHAVAVAPNNVMGYNLLANEMYKRNRGEDALELYRRALALDPHYWATNFSMGLTECGLGRLGDCARHLQTATDVDDSNPAEFAVLGDAHMRLGDYSGAEAELRRGIQASPNAAQLHLLLGLTLMRQGKLDAAQQAFVDEARLSPAFAAAANERLEEARRLQRDGGWQNWRPGPDYP